MPFPETRRVLYGKNPLDNVVCQLRFPPILRIDAEIPADFQEKVRAQFPNYSESAEWNIEVPPGIKGQVPPEILRQALQASGVKNCAFSSEDGQWKINLTRTFVALSTTKYVRWEEFKAKLRIPLDALIAVYKPDYFSRIGLRYVDIIRRSTLSLSDADWKDLLQPYIAAILAAPNVGQNVKSFENKYDIGLSDGQSIVRIITGLVEDENSNEICYKIDSDFFNSSKTKIESAIERLDYFNVRGSRLIQWCITERLHNAMEPQQI